MKTLDHLLAALQKKRTELRESEKGFSLVELLVVVLIIAVLAAIAIPMYLSSVDRAEEAAREAACSNATSAYVVQLFENADPDDAAAEAASQASNPDGGLEVLVVSADSDGAVFTVEGRTCERGIIEDND